jgi:tetratricopeptide (TPR) repeat protein
LWIDVVEFRRLLENGRTADMQGELSATRQHLAKAVGLYRGEFLSGFYIKDSTPFEDWQLIAQESIRRQQATALQRLVEIHAARGQFEQAIDYGRRWLALDPLEEAVHRHLMQLYSFAGQHFEALRQYERCRSLLERELGEKPGEETEQLREHIAFRKPLPGTGRWWEQHLGGPASLRSKPFPGTPLFLFAQISAADEEQANQKELRLRQAIGEKRGRILAAEGQMVCGFFPTADAAVRAALSTQIQGCTIDSKMRIVLLAGEHAQQQVPSSKLVERAEMLLDASYEGQVLLNETAAELAGGVELPEGTTLSYLGAHRLKDLGPAQPIHMLEHPDLPHELHCLETLDSHPNNLRIQPTPFISRERELAAVQGFFELEDVRL